jgi:predicted transcriptional regulator YdeE
MEPKIVEEDSFIVAGILNRIKPEEDNEDRYGAIWKEFETIHPRIKGLSVDKAYYGVSFSAREGIGVDYIAGMAVSDPTIVPENLEKREVPKARYAVFECPLAEIGETYRYAFAEWLPRAPFILNTAVPFFEKYPPQGEEASMVQIYIPIKPK